MLTVTAQWLITINNMRICLKKNENIVAPLLLYKKEKHLAPRGLPLPGIKSIFVIFDLLTHNFCQLCIFFGSLSCVCKEEREIETSWRASCLSASHPAPRNVSNHRPDISARRSLWAYLMRRWAGSLWYIALSLSGRTQIGEWTTGTRPSVSRVKYISSDSEEIFLNYSVFCKTLYNLQTI